MSLKQSWHHLCAGLPAAVFAASTLLSPAVNAQAQTDYPSKPIRLVIGFAAGSATDTLGRVIAAPLAQRLGQQVIIDNRPGAYSVIASSQVSKAAPDGYTLLLGTNSGLVAAPAGLLANVPYDPFTDFTRIGQVATTGFTLSSGPALEPSTGPELIAYLKKNSGKTFCAAANANGRVLCEALGQATQSQLTVVPYKSSPEAATALMSGEVQVMFVDLPSAVNRVKQKQIKAYALMADEASQVLPQLPVARDIGLGDLPSVVGWYGVFGPRGMPQPLATKITAALDWVVAQPQVRQQIIAAGFEPAFLTGDALLPRMRKNYESWKKMLPQYNIQPER